MDKDEALLRYKAAISIFKNWRENDAITEDDFSEISTILARKYGLSPLSIFLENDLLCVENRANIR